MWINKFLLLEIDMHYQMRVIKISDHWLSLLEAYIEK